MDVCVAAAGILASPPASALDVSSEVFQKVRRSLEVSPGVWLLIQSAMAGAEREYEWRPVHCTGSREADAAVWERGQHRPDCKYLWERRTRGTVEYSLSILFNS